MTSRTPIASPSTADSDQQADAASFEEQPDRRPSRPTWWLQVALAVAFAWGYDAVRALHGDVRAAALRHGRTMLRWDRVLHFGGLSALSKWVDRHDVAADVFSGYYVVMHLGAVCVVLIALWVDGRLYRWHRDALLLLSGLAFAVFWFYPVAPPRLVGGQFADSVKDTLPFAYHAEATTANLYAAVPSLHVAWALWCAIALWSISRHWAVRAVAVGHVGMTTATVLATGNHYFIDVLSGILVTLVGYAVLPVVIGAGRRLAPALVRVEPRYIRRRAAEGAQAYSPYTPNGVMRSGPRVRESR